MANRTRKRLSKSELKKDPIYDNLEAGLVFVKARYKELLGGLLVLVLGIVAITAITESSRRADEEAMAGYITASSLYDQALMLAAEGDIQSSVQALSACNSIAMENWNRHPQRSWGRKSAIIAVKILTLQGQDDQALSLIADVLAARPGREVEIAAHVHLATVLENRGSPQDLINAEESYRRVIELTQGNEDFIPLTAEAMMGLSRVWWERGNRETSREWLDRYLELQPDTTAFAGFHLARLNVR